MPLDSDPVDNEEGRKSEMRRCVLPQSWICNCLQSKEIPRQDESNDLKEGRVFKSGWIYWEESKQISMQPLSHLVQLVTLPEGVSIHRGGSLCQTLSKGSKSFLYSCRANLSVIPAM